MTPLPRALLLCGALSLLAPSAALARGDRQEPATAVRDVDLVICIDNSGSMSGLIDACRKKLWDVCSLMAQARPEPRLRVALISYGGNDNPDDGYVVIRKELTEEMDLVYDALFQLQADGGTELVGRTIHHALTRLQWSDRPGALRVMIVAGNESADQDQEHRFKETAQAALQQQVVVHAVYCGGAEDPDAASWRELARSGGGEFTSIDQQGTVSIASPFDEELTRLGVGLNATYLPYGERGEWCGANQARQDANAAACDQATAAARAAGKAQHVYRNDSWDLVDRAGKEGFAWKELQEDELPEALRGKSEAEKDAAIKALRDQRAALQARIKELDLKRQAYVAEQLEQFRGAERSLDFAMARAIRSQAEKLGFRFE